MSDRSRTTFKINYRPFVDTRNGYLTDSLKSQTENRNFREIVFDILEIWEMPVALRQVEGVDLKRETWVSIQALLERIFFLAGLNGVDNGELVDFMASYLNGRCVNVSSVVDKLEDIRVTMENLQIVTSTSSASDFNEGEQSKSSADVRSVSEEEICSF